MRTVLGLIHLTNRQSCRAIDKACEIAVSYGAYRLRNIRQLIKRQAPKQEQLELIQEHPIIRSLDVYGELVKESLRKSPASWDRNRPAGNDER